MVEVSLTVGKLDASLALLLTKDHHMIEFPTILLPNGVKAGSIVKISCERDLKTEEEEHKRFLAVQEEILSTFGKNLPKAPLLKIKNVTQTSCVLEWDALDLGTASLKNLTLFKDGKKLGAIPQPLSNRTTKLSGLPIDKTFHFQLKMDSTAGVYTSEVVEVTTHKMTDLSGIHVCLGDITPNDQFTVDDIQQTLKNMGAHYPALDKMKVETTHYITTRENKQNPEFIKANDMNIPIIRPEWLKACEKERRIVGVRDFYVKECVLPDIFAKNYWQKPVNSAAESTAESTGASLETSDKSRASEKPTEVVSSGSENVKAQNTRPENSAAGIEANSENSKPDNSAANTAEPNTAGPEKVESEKVAPEKVASEKVESENVGSEQLAETPSLAVSGSSSQSRDLDTPKNTPTDASLTKGTSESPEGDDKDGTIGETLANEQGSTVPENIDAQMLSKVEAVDKKTENVKEKSDTVEEKSEAVEKKSEAVENKTKAVENKSETITEKSVLSEGFNSGTSLKELNGSQEVDLATGTAVEASAKKDEAKDEEKVAKGPVPIVEKGEGPKEGPKGQVENPDTEIASKHTHSNGNEKHVSEPEHDQRDKLASLEEVSL